MSERHEGADRARNLAAFGADLARWPEGQAGAAREALLADPAFRLAWEAERRLDASLATYRDSIDREIASAGAADRVARQVQSRYRAATFTGLAWRKVAAAMVVAGALGGAMNLVLPDQAAETADVGTVDPLLSLDDTAL